MIEASIKLPILIVAYSDLTITALLGHASRGVTQRYSRLDEPLRTAVTALSDHIIQLLDGVHAH